MEIIRRAVVIVSCVAVSFWSASSVAPAQTMADIAGTWNNILYSTPSRLTLYQGWIQHPLLGTNLVVLNIEEKSLFDAQTGTVVVQPDGSFSGSASGTVSLIGGGQMVASTPPHLPVTFSMNAACDFMFAMKNPGGTPAQDIELLLKAPASLSNAELAGTWKAVTFATPAQLILQMDPYYNTYVTNVVCPSDFKVHTSTLTTYANGTLLLNDGGNLMSGTFSVVGPGKVDATMNIPTVGEYTLHFFVNQSKNVMAAINANDPTSKEMLLLVKQPTSAVTADFKGLWRWGSFMTPLRLTQNWTYYGVLTDIHEKNQFKFEVSSDAVGHNGIFTSPNGPIVGAGILNGAGVLQTTATNASGLVTSDAFWVNDAKDVMVTVKAEGDNRITIATRAPAESVRRESLGMVAFSLFTGPEPGLVVSWASDTNHMLQTSSDLNHWNTLADTAGQSSYTADSTAGTNAFFRVMETD